jgi:hypothetical protein
VKVRELLTDRSKWTQQVAARNADGLCVSHDSPEASCFCLIGALQHCYPDTDIRYKLYDRIADELDKNGSLRYRSCPDVLIIRWNDEEKRTFEEVKALIDRLDL